MPWSFPSLVLCDSWATFCFLLSHHAMILKLEFPSLHLSFLYSFSVSQVEGHTSRCAQAWPHLVTYHLDIVELEPLLPLASRISTYFIEWYSLTWTLHSFRPYLVTYHLEIVELEPLLPLASRISTYFLEWYSLTWTLHSLDLIWLNITLRLLNLSPCYL